MTNSGGPKRLTGWDSGRKYLCMSHSGPVLHRVLGWGGERSGLVGSFWADEFR